MGERDLDRVFQWRCDPEIYRWFKQQDGPLEWDGHVSWWRGRSPDRRDLIIEHHDRPVGVVAIATDGDVGIYLGEKSVWGRGIATKALEIALEEVDREVSAEIHEDNERSQRLFDRVGFERDGADGPWLHYEYSPM